MPNLEFRKSINKRLAYHFSGTGTSSKLSFTKTFRYIMSSSEKLVALNFEVFGRVQGVFFRKYTEKEAKKLGLRGWCMNTNRDTVNGILEGSPTKIAEMKTWLQKTGSPQSRIDKAVFTNEHDIAKYNFDSFSIKH